MLVYAGLVQFEITVSLLVALLVKPKESCEEHQLLNGQYQFLKSSHNLVLKQLAILLF